jgi:hypothetical protein
MKLLENEKTYTVATKCIGWPSTSARIINTLGTVNGIGEQGMRIANPTKAANLSMTSLTKDNSEQALRKWLDREVIRPRLELNTMKNQFGLVISGNWVFHGLKCQTLINIGAMAVFYLLWFIDSPLHWSTERK